MKKFLFTLAALLMAGSAFADNYLYIDDIELTQEFVEQSSAKARQIDVAVKAHFDQWTNAWDVTFDFGEVICRGTVADEEGNIIAPDMTLQGMNKNGVIVNIPVALNANDDADHFIAANAVAGYYYPEGSDPDEDDPVQYGAVKWAPGDYECMFMLTLRFPQYFEGGDITITTLCASGSDDRPGVEVAPKNQPCERVAHVTVTGGTPPEPEVTATPVINVENNEEGEYLMISATGDGTVKLYIDGMEVSNPFQYNYQDEEHEIVITATAQEEGKEISETAELTYIVPAKTPTPPEPQVTEKPVITYFVDMDAETVTITATGNGTVILYNDDIEVARGEGVATYVVPFTEDPEGEEMGFSATAQEEGKEVSEYALATIEIPGKQPVPYETPAPVITTDLTDDALVITVTGEGTVTLYVQYIDNETGEMTTETYVGEGTVTQEIARGEEDAFINYWAVAQADEDAVPGTTGVEYYVEVPAKEGGVEPPVDPHAEGYWIVTYDVNGEEVWQELIQDNGDYTGIVRLGYGIYGTFDYYGGGTRPDVSYIMVVNGVRYGAAEDGTLTVLGDAMQNPLTEGENKYVLEEGVGKVYNMGIAIDEFTGNMYVYAAVAGFTELDEMNADKAVAGVRYFNMAGQEMQEANGVTIVVTTYTDGTTSAVKVIK